jgi:hypothetical protein
MLIEIPVAIAELFDKLSILEIKKVHFSDSARRGLVESELNQLTQILKKHEVDLFLTHDLYRQLYDTNQELWNICELRRQFEQNNQFDHAFIEQSRLEYQTNDRRAHIKQQINKHFESSSIEVKSYSGFSYVNPNGS